MFFDYYLIRKISWLKTIRTTSDYRIILNSLFMLSLIGNGGHRHEIFKRRKAIHHHALSAGRKCHRSFQLTRYPSKHLIPLVQLLSDRQLGQAFEIFISRIRITPSQSWKIAEYHHNFEIRWLSGIRTIEGTASCFRAVLWKIWSSHNMRGAGCWPRYILQPYVTQQARQCLVW